MKITYLVEIYSDDRVDNWTKQFITKQDAEEYIKNYQDDNDQYISKISLYEIIKHHVIKKP